jgi:hypothetical protein
MGSIVAYAGAWRQRVAQAYGWRALGVLALLVLGCRLGVAQVGPRMCWRWTARTCAGGAPGRCSWRARGWR